MIDAGDEAPDIEVRGATEAVEIGEAMKGMLARVWEEQDRTKAALTSARDFAAVSAHELRTPLTAMRTNLEVLSTLDLPDEQRKEVLNDVIRTQSRIEATLGALERLAQGELITDDDHVPVDITELLDRAAHDAMRVYPDLDVSLVPAPDGDHRGTARGSAAGGRQRHRQRRQTRRRHPRSAVGGEFARRGRDRHRRRRDRASRRRNAGWCSSGSPAGRRRRAPARVSGLALVAQQAEIHGGTASLEASPLGGAAARLAPARPAVTTQAP